MVEMFFNHPGTAPRTRHRKPDELAKLADELPVGAYLYERKWDGFRAIVFRGKDER
jgi:ATP-dependent DNA ligase